MVDSDPAAERLDRFSKAISAKTMAGFNVVDRNDKDLVAVVVLPEKPINHVVHVLITIFTCLIWAPVWAALVLLHIRRATGSYFYRRIWNPF